MGNKSGPLVLTPIETARLLRIGRGTVYEQIRCGNIPSIRMGRRILIPRAALLKKLESAGCDGSVLK
ncbi:MAG: excisionase family DNA-binding protein [Chloroflexota bacterium]|nr:excisionase family DNA-binding protein [Chloroflexota bacterium]